MGTNINAIKFIAKKSSGTEDDLVEAGYGQSIEELEQTGLIIRGVNSNGNHTWMASKSALKLAHDFFDQPNIFQKTVSSILYYASRI